MDRLRVGLGGGGRLWGRRAGLKPGLYMGGLRGRRAGRKGGLRNRSTDLKIGHYSGLRIGGRGRIAVGKVLVDPVADGIAPIVGAKGVDVLVPGEMDGLDEGLGEIGDGAGGARFYIALEDGGDETAKGSAQIVGGEVLSREEIGQFAGELIDGEGPGLFAGVVEAEAGMLDVAGSAAVAAVGKGEAAQGHAVL